MTYKRFIKGFKSTIEDHSNRNERLKYDKKYTKSKKSLHNHIKLRNVWFIHE